MERPAIEVRSIIYNFSDTKKLKFVYTEGQILCNLLKAKIEILTSLLHVHAVLWARSKAPHISLCTSTPVRTECHETAPQVPVTAFQTGEVHVASIFRTAVSTGIHLHPEHGGSMYL
jgi:hypothetical protein